ncbi:MAG: zinc ribbon domain-containing protein [Clostridia bacterium]|nr:zinc ribbon domain-containing protein [Clostridia bacterium]
MPILQYRCPRCGKQFDELVKKFDVPVFCPQCGERAERSYCGEMLSATGKPSKKCSGNCKTCGGCK